MKKPAFLSTSLGTGQALFFSAWITVFVATVAAYWPGLHGPFLLDDFDAIGALGSFGGVKDWESLRAFVFGGQAGPTGRPLSLLTFLLDANDWPADSFPFKRTNLVIHLINGALLGVLLTQIMRVVGSNEGRAKWIVLAATAAWMLHPFLVSTNLYVVQRMAQLAATFMLAGLVLYMYGRALLPARSKSAYWIMSIAIAVFTLLALLSKENGILLPLLVGVLELTIFASRDGNRSDLNRYWSTIFLALPTAVIVLYLVYRAADGNFFAAVPPREFSTWERLLTEARILSDYLKHWFIPELYTAGVFQDHFAKSTGILSPATTLLGIMLHLSLITLAFVKRRQWPILALAILFFYGNHVLESTVIDLELYFEHRNYLAVGFLFLPLFCWSADRIKPANMVLAVMAMLLVLGGFTRYSADVWSDHRSMVELAAVTVPTSVRAQGQLATILHDTGQSEAAIQVLDKAIESIPSDHPLLLVTKLNVSCTQGWLTADTFEHIGARLARRFYDPRAIRLYTELISLVASGRCPAISINHIRSMFEEMLMTDANADPRSLGYSHIRYFLGVTYVHGDDPGKAVDEFRESLNAEPGASPALAMAALLASNDYFAQALEMSDLALELIDKEADLRAGQSTVSKEQVLNFQKVVRDDIRNRGQAGTARQVP